MLIKVISVWLDYNFYFCAFCVFSARYTYYFIFWGKKVRGVKLGIEVKIISSKEGH